MDHPYGRGPPSDRLASEAFYAGLKLGKQLSAGGRQPSDPRAMARYPAERHGPPATYGQPAASYQPNTKRSACAMLEQNGWSVTALSGSAGMPDGPVMIDHFERRPVYASHPSRREVMLVPNMDIVAVCKDGRKFSERDMQ